MARVKRGVTGHAKHKKVLKAAKGYYGRRKNTIRVAKQAVEKANQYAFRDRKRRKRTFRALWIQRLNAAVRPFGLNYSRFIDGLAQGRPAGRPQGAVRPRDHASRRRFRRSWRRPRPRCRPRLESFTVVHFRLSCAGEPAHPAEVSTTALLSGMAGTSPAMTDDERSACHVRHLDSSNSRSSPTSRPRPTRRRSKPCASRRWARAARCRRCCARSARMTPEQRKEQGPLINGLKDKVTAALAARKDALKDAALDAAAQHRERRRHAAGARGRRPRPAASTRSAR